MKKYTVKLTKEERENLPFLTKTGKHAASKILHARILLASDEGDYIRLCFLAKFHLFIHVNFTIY